MRLLFAAALAGVIPGWSTDSIFAAVTAALLASVVLYFVEKRFLKDAS